MTIETLHPIKFSANDPAAADWLEALDFLDPMIQSREALDQLIRTAPTQRLADWLMGIVDFRSMLADVTGRPF